MPVCQFVTSGHADHYDVISVTVLNRTDGVVDKLRLRLKDVLGVKQVPGNPNFRNGVAPHIWEDSGKVEWYAFRPSRGGLFRHAAGCEQSIWECSGIV